MQAKDNAELVAQVHALNKAQLVELYRRLNNGKVGDTARTSLGEYQRMVLSFPESMVADVLSVPSPAIPAPARVDPAVAVAQLQSALQALIEAPKAELDQAAVERLVDAKVAPFAARVGDLAGRFADLERGVLNAIDGLTDLVKNAQPRVETLVVREPEGKVKVKDRTRREFKRVLQLAAARKNILLVGPAGCGKTHLAAQVAEALDLPFGSMSCTAGASESQLTGWLLPVGESGKFEYVPSVFVQLYERGGVFLLDEIDAADPNLLLIINQALANGSFFLPQRLGNPEVKRHKDFICIAAANTYGHGGDMVYAGRERLDGATLDRFRVGLIPLDYDAELEEALVEQQLLRWGRAVRARIAELKLRRVLSTRFLIDASDMLAAGWDYEEVVEAFFADWPKDERNKVADIPAPAARLKAAA